MISLVIFLMCLFVALGVSVLAGAADFRTLSIPNMYSVYVVAAFLCAYVVLYLGGQADFVFSSFPSHLFSALVAFVVTFVLFAFGVLGAGDSKFITACALWFGLKILPIFFFFMTLLGAGLGVAALYVRKEKPVVNPLAGGWVDQVQKGASKVPYGVAIAFGMLIASLYAGYFSPEVLSLFLAQGDGSGAS